MSEASAYPDAIIRDLRQVHAAMARVDRDCAAFLATVSDTQRASARNLLHYLALRSHDLRAMQPVLASWGLSSLGRTESHVRHGLENVLRLLCRAEDLAVEDEAETPAITNEHGEALLAQHTDDLFGPAPDNRQVRIMVTMPGEASTDYRLVRDLVAAGMDCMRINCAHDSPDVWGRLVQHLTRARIELHRECRIAMDLGGPKVRTAALPPGPSVVKIKPERDMFGQVTRPAVVAFIARGRSGEVRTPADAVFEIDDMPSSVQVGDLVSFVDARGKHRELHVRAAQAHLVVTESDRTAYVTPETAFRFGSSLFRSPLNVPTVPASLLLKRGDLLVLTPESEAGRPALRDGNDQVVAPASIGITLPEVLQDVRVGQPVWFDDGKMGGLVRSVGANQIVMEITHARPEGSHLQGGKGVNLPETNLRLPALTAKDKEDLAFVVQHADLVGYSFVRSADDMRDLREEMRRLGAQQLGVILKIETRRAFQELPRLLLAAMQGGPFGVMIARGDLAVECGFERLAEVQEEILWICEAAHAPVVWATQVLETMAKTGMPSRAEVTDAAMSERAECVMLNKGPYVCDAVRTLDDILRRMQTHQSKKRAVLRPLDVARHLLSELTERAGELEPTSESPTTLARPLC